jgi:ABC-type taurine transport system ATPase subunit
MVAANVDILRDALLGEAWGYLARLEKDAHAGGFVTHETTEAIKLAKTAMELRVMADRIARVRESLILNSERRYEFTV